MSGPTGPATDPDPVFHLDAAPGADLRCRVLRGALPLRHWQQCAGSYRLALTSEDRDGSYVVQARAGSGPIASSLGYAYDRTPPERAQVSGPAGPSRERPTWSWEQPPGTTSQCALLRDATVVVADVDCAPGRTPEPASAGIHALLVVLRDAAGNRAPAASSPEFAYDTTPPGAPTVLVGAGHQADRAPVYAAAVEPGATTQCRAVGPAGPLAGWAACELPTSADLAGQPAGDFALEVRVTDAAGNPGEAGRAVHRVADVLAAPQVTAPASPGRSGPVRFGVIPARPGESLQCRLVGRGRPGPAFPCAGDVPLDLTAEPDGAYVLEAGRAGGLGPVGRAGYVLDRLPPRPLVFTAEPARVGSSAVLRWEWPEEPDVAYACRVSGPGESVVMDGSCRSGVNVDLAEQPDGIWRLQVSAVDPAGNTTTSGLEHLLDRSAPALTVLPPPRSAGTAPVWALAGGPAACTLLHGGEVVHPETACDGAYAAELDGRPDGVYQLVVRLDAALRTSAVQVSDHVLDTEPPVLSVTRLPGVPAAFTGTSNDPTAVMTCRVVDVGDWQPCDASPSGLLPVDLAGLPDGRYAVEVRAVDPAGLAGTARAEHLVDTVAPSAVRVEAPADRAGTFPSWTFGRYETGAGLACTLVDARGAQDVACTPAGFTTGPLAADGPLLLSVVVVDRAGNRSAPATAGVVHDASAPDLREPVPAQAPFGRGRTVRWGLLAEPGTTLTCQVEREAAVVRPAAACGGSYELALADDAPDGRYVLAVTATDAAGRTSTRQAGHLLDTSPPAAPVTTAAPASPGRGTTVSWAVAAGASELLTCQLLRSGAALEPPRSCDGTETVDLRLLGPGAGSYALRTRSQDAAGNVSAPATTAAYTWSRDAAADVAWQHVPEGDLRSTPGPWVFSRAPGARYRCVLQRDGVVLDVRRGCAGSYALDRPDRSGRYTLQVYVTVRGRTSSAPAVRGFSLDLDDPAGPVLSSSPPQAGSDRSVAWSWETGGDEDVQCRPVRVDAAVPDWGDCGGAGGTFHTQLDAEGGWRFEVRARARSGRTSPVTSSATYRYDTTAPAPVEIALPADTGVAGRAASARWDFTAAPSLSAGCTVTRAGLLVARDDTCPSGLVLDLRGRPAGTYALTVRLRDTAGNETRVLSSFRLLAPPVDPAAAVPAASGPLPPARPPLALTAGRADPGPAAPGRTATAGRGPSARPGSAGRLDPARRDTAAHRAHAGRPAAPTVLGAPPAGPGVPGPLDAALREVVADTLRRPAVPLALLGLVLAFLLVQNRLDRRDPKLAGAPVLAGPDLEFGPVLRTGRPS